MDNQRTGSYEPGTVDAPYAGTDRVIGEPTPSFARTELRAGTGFYPGTATGENVMPVRDSDRGI